MTRKPITLYSRGMTNIVAAMNAHGVRRLVCVSSSVTDPLTRSHHTGGGFLFEKVLKPLFTNVVGKTTYADMQLMEQLVTDKQPRLGDRPAVGAVRNSGRHDLSGRGGLRARAIHLEE